MGDEMVKDLKDEVSDPKASRVTVGGWPLRKDTGALQASIADEVTPTEDGVKMVIGRGVKWYGAFWELVGRMTRKGFRKYPWFWRTWRKNYDKYMGILGVKSAASGRMLGPIGSGENAEFDAARDRVNDRARQNWRKSAGLTK